MLPARVTAVGVAIAGEQYYKGRNAGVAASHGSIVAR